MYWVKRYVAALDASSACAVSSASGTRRVGRSSLGGAVVEEGSGTVSRVEIGFPEFRWHDVRPLSAASLSASPICPGVSIAE